MNLHFLTPQNNKRHAQLMATEVNRNYRIAKLPFQRTFQESKSTCTYALINFETPWTQQLELLSIYLHELDSAHKLEEDLISCGAWWASCPGQLGHPPRRRGGAGDRPGHDIYLADPSSRTYSSYVINCIKFSKTRFYSQFGQLLFFIIMFFQLKFLTLILI